MTEVEPAPANQVERAWLVIALIMASACVAQAFGRFSWGVVLPNARDDLLGGSNSLAGLLGTLNVTAYLAGTLAVSWASAKLTLVGLMRLGLVISTAGLGIASIARSGPTLAVALVAMGVGGALIWIPAPALAVRALSFDRAGMAVGLVGSGIGIGLVFAGQMAGVVERRSSDGTYWQALYRVEFAIALVVLAGTFLFLRSAGDRPGGSGGFGGIAALRTVRGWVPAVVAYASFGFAYILVIGFLVARLEDDSGFSSSHASTMFSIMGGAVVIGGLALGRLSDRMGRRVVLTSSFVLFGACGLLVLTGRQPWVAIAAFGIGIMFSGMPAQIVAHIIDNTTVDTYGPAFSAATLAFGVTQMISPQVGGAIADRAGSFGLVFVLAAVVSLIGAAAASRLPAPLVPGATEPSSHRRP